MWCPNALPGMKDLSLHLLECGEKLVSTASPPWGLPQLKTQPCPILRLLPERPIPEDCSHWGPALSMSCFTGPEFSLCPTLLLLPHSHKCSSWQHLLIRCYLNLYPRELRIKSPIMSHVSMYQIHVFFFRVLIFVGWLCMHQCFHKIIF